MKTKLTLLFLLVSVLAAGCGAVCPVLKIADESCPAVSVIFPDGHVEKHACRDMVDGAKRVEMERAAAK